MYWVKRSDLSRDFLLGIARFLYKILLGGKKIERRLVEKYSLFAYRVLHGKNFFDFMRPWTHHIFQEHP